MTRLLAIAGIPLCAISLWAQPQTIVSTRVSTAPSGAQYYVDGKAYFSPQVFLWPAGSKHVLSVEPPVQSGVRFGERHTFSGWTDSTGRLTASGPSISITAHPEIASFTAGMTVDYQVTVRVVDCPVSENSRCDSPGTAIVGGTTFDRDGSMYVTPNSVLTLAAFPKPGYVFAGWQLGTGYSDAFLSSVTVTGPMSVQPRFEPAKAITFLTSPPDLQVLADRQPLMTPVTVDWGQGTRHVIGAPSPQDDLTGHSWVFDSWTHGGGQNSLYTVDKTNVRETLTATFVPGARIFLVTNPAGLKLSIDGRANLLSYAFIWGVGTTHAISALDGQTDAAGRRYVFKSWSNGGAAVQQYTVPQEAAADGLRLTANFEALNRVTVQSVPPGLAIPIDGVECRTPCTIERRAGASIRVAAPLSIPAGDGTRLDFEGWADGGSPERSWTLDADSRTLVVRYKTMHRLAAFVEPEGGAGIRIEPFSTDAFYLEGTAVQVAADPSPGFRFRAWDGDLSGPNRSGVLSMAGPRAVRALLDRVPFVAETGVRNAAGETPTTGVAAGSLVSILGASLAPAYEVGPSSPLAQSIAGVTVRVDGRMLPLLFVSPEQINAQLPSDIEEGERTLTVRWEGQPEATAVFTVVRNAPGLFAVAAHADASPVTAENPARAGETLSIFGAGFGPYLRQPPYGFAVPDAPAFPLADPVEVLAGDAVIEPLFSGAAPGQVGTVVTRFRLPDSLAGPALSLRVRVNGQDSNTINLAIQ